MILKDFQTKNLLSERQKNRTNTEARNLGVSQVESIRNDKGKSWDAFTQPRYSCTLNKYHFSHIQSMPWTPWKLGKDKLAHTSKMFIPSLVFTGEAPLVSLLLRWKTSQGKNLFQFVEVLKFIPWT